MERFGLRIVYFNHNTRRIGTFLRCFNLGRCLVGRGHEVTIIAPNPSSCSGIRREEIDGVRLLWTPHLRATDEIGHGDYAGRVLRYFVNALAGLRIDCDIVHAFALAHASTSIGAIAVKARDLPLVTDWDDWWGRGGLAREHGPVIHSIMTLLEEKVSVLGDGLTAISTVLANRAISLGVSPSKVFLLPSGVDIESIKPIDQDYARSVLGMNRSLKIVLYEAGAWPSSSRLSSHLSFLMDVARRLKEMFQTSEDFRMVFLGIAPSPSLVEYAERLKIREQVVFVKRQPFQRLPLFLSAADVLVLPVEATIEDVARWPGRIGDYLASGRPIVATDLGDVGQIVRKEDCGLTATAGDVEGFAEKTHFLLLDDELGDRLGANSRRLAEERYSWKRISDELELIYRKVCASR